LQELYGNSKATEEEMKLFARSYFREIKLDTTNTLWSDLLTGVLRNLKKSKLKTTIHYLVVGDLLGNNANSYHPTYFTTIEEACWEKSISTEIKKMGTMLSGIKFHLECNK
jgi:hypothetical protein